MIWAPLTPLISFFSWIYTSWGTLLCCLVQASYLNLKTFALALPPAWAIQMKSQLLKTFSTTQSKISTPFIYQLSFVCFISLSTYYLFILYINLAYYLSFPWDSEFHVGKAFCLLCSWLYPPWWRQCLAIMDRIVESLQIHILKP